MVITEKFDKVNRKIRQSGAGGQEGDVVGVGLSKEFLKELPFQSWFLLSLLTAAAAICFGTSIKKSL